MSAFMTLVYGEGDSPRNRAIRRLTQCEPEKLLGLTSPAYSVVMGVSLSSCLVTISKLPQPPSCLIY